MLTADQKLSKINDLCRHPGSFHWSGRQMADAIMRVIADKNQPIPYDLSDEDRPIPYELAHDAVYEEIDVPDTS